MLNIDSEYEAALKSLYRDYGQVLSAGTRFIQEGTQDTKVYFILDGLAAVFFGQDPNEHMLWLLESGDFVGELALLDNLPRSASVETLKESRVIVLDRENFYNLISDFPSLALKVIRTMGMRMRKLDAKYKLYLGYKPQDMDWVATREAAEA